MIRQAHGPNEWLAEIPAWVIQDGNYDDFAIGQTCRFALGCGPEELESTAAGPKAAMSLGDGLYAVTAEVRFPMPLVPDDLGLSGAFFVDAGSLFGTSDRVKSLSASCGVAVTQGQVPNVCLEDDSSIRVSAGTSLLWNSPLGPLRADFGFAIMKESYDKEQLFRFGASTKF